MTQLVPDKRKDRRRRAPAVLAAAALAAAAALRALRAGDGPAAAVASRESPQNGSARDSLLCISPSYAPDTTPTAIRAGQLLDNLAARWDITVLTESRGSQAGGRVRVEVVAGRRPVWLLAQLRRLRMNKLIELLLWPDESVFWLPWAVLAGRRAARAGAPRAIVVFMMPYSAGLAGIALSRITGLPLILNLDDSPTCTDMHPSFPTRLHHRLAIALEDLYARSADAIVYVSQRNLARVRERQPEAVRSRFRLVRYGADPTAFRPQAAEGSDFQIAYVGAMSGWWALIEEQQPPRGTRAAYAAWNRLGRYELTALDPRTASPVVIGRAILAVIDAHPEWSGRVKLALYGNPYPPAVVARALQSTGVDGVVSVFDPLPHDEVTGIMCRADLLFLTLPKRLDGSPGGRISAKTYEYLMTDRPILAAVSPGENRDYLAGKPGVWLVDPDDGERMQEVICELAQAKFEGRARTYDRSALREELSYETRAREFDEAVRSGIEHGLERARPRAQRANSSPR